MSNEIWQWRMDDGEPYEWVFLKGVYFDADDAARKVSEAHYESCGGACDWSQESEETIIIQAPDGTVTKHAIWWEPSVDHCARQIGEAEALQALRAAVREMANDLGVI